MPIRKKGYADTALDRYIHEQKIPKRVQPYSYSGRPLAKIRVKTPADDPKILSVVRPASEK